MYSPTFNLSWWFFEEILCQFAVPYICDAELNFTLTFLFGDCLKKFWWWWSVLLAPIFVFYFKIHGLLRFYIIVFKNITRTRFLEDTIVYRGNGVNTRSNLKKWGPETLNQAVTKPTKCHSNLCMLTLMFFYFTSIRIQFRNIYRLVVVYVRRRTHVNILIFISSIPSYR